MGPAFPKGNAMWPWLPLPDWMGRGTPIAVAGLVWACRLRLMWHEAMGAVLSLAKARLWVGCGPICVWPADATSAPKALQSQGAAQGADHRAASCAGIFVIMGDKHGWQPGAADAVKDKAPDLAAQLRIEF